MACLATTRTNALTSRRTTARPGVRPGRAPVVVVKALTLREVSDWVGQAFVKIMSKPETNVDHFAENNFSGKITRSRRPFKDGWTSKPGATLPAEAMQRDDKEAEGYLDGAVKRVVNNNFKGDATEPDWVNTSGWKGDIHKKGSARNARDGFHAKKM